MFEISRVGSSRAGWSGRVESGRFGRVGKGREVIEISRVGSDSPRPNPAREKSMLTCDKTPICLALKSSLRGHTLSLQSTTRHAMRQKKVDGGGGGGEGGYYIVA